LEVITIIIAEQRKIYKLFQPLIIVDSPRGPSGQQ